MMEGVDDDKRRGGPCQGLVLGCVIAKKSAVAGLRVKIFPIF